MNYEKIYNSLIQSRKFRGLDRSKLGFATECHHIVPRCLGGSDEESNLVLLTGREHYLAHLLLAKFAAGQAYHKMLHALANFQTDKYGTRSLSSKQIGKARDALQRSVALGEHPWQTEEYKLYMKARNAEEALAGNHNFQSAAFRKYKSEFQQQILHCHCGMTGKRGGMGKAHMANCKYKPYMSLALMRSGVLPSYSYSKCLMPRTNSETMRLKAAQGKLLQQSKEWQDRQRLRREQSGLKRKANAEAGAASGERLSALQKLYHICPHCGKAGKGSVMKRWHFDKCKSKPGKRKHRQWSTETYDN